MAAAAAAAAAGMDAESLAGDECLEEDEEELETSLEDPEQDTVGKTVPGGRSCGLLTRRGITLRVLLKDGLIEPGEGVLSIYYLVRELLSPASQGNPVKKVKMAARQV
ncbi:MPN domain-containing protein-like [Ahaetulla prasina]|uniref:MPN domain-containing protein-like n=1 Tax=Ahaetulla prasina TaxID=499056 RepID=UPI0026477519|nr:MPN domain-containing protein-like [Ahaetulla prasina]